MRRNAAAGDCAGTGESACAGSRPPRRSRRSGARTAAEATVSARCAGRAGRCAAVRRVSMPGESRVVCISAQSLDRAVAAARAGAGVARHRATQPRSRAGACSGGAAAAGVKPNPSSGGRRNRPQRLGWALRRGVNAWHARTTGAAKTQAAWREADGAAPGRAEAGDCFASACMSRLAAEAEAARKAGGRRARDRWARPPSARARARPTRR